MIRILLGILFFIGGLSGIGMKESTPKPLVIILDIILIIAGISSVIENKQQKEDKENKIKRNLDRNNLFHIDKRLGQLKIDIERCYFKIEYNPEIINKIFLKQKNFKIVKH